jgi:protein-S-isoprenylcysteine O-methyltransferase Ste14
VIDHKDPLLRFVALLLAVIAVGLLVYFSAIAMRPEVEQALGLLAWAQTDATQTASVVMMALACVWTSVAQFALGNSWRIGIPSEAPALRTNGPFALSRNPIFLGMLMFIAGITLWSPSAVTIALLTASYIALEVQIRCEEKFLEAHHGEAYRIYRGLVRRWI